MVFWYTVDLPRNKPCWEVNPNLWDCFSLAMQQRYGVDPVRSEIYTEEYVVQRMDMEISNRELRNGPAT